MKKPPRGPKDTGQETPTYRPLAKMLVKFFAKRLDTPTSTWLDPCRGIGPRYPFYDNFPLDRRDWCEIRQGRDFLARTVACAITMSNIPFKTEISRAFMRHAMLLGGKDIVFLVPNRAAQGLRHRNEFASRHGYGHRTTIRLPPFPGNFFTTGGVQLVAHHWQRGYRGPLDQYEFKARGALRPGKLKSGIAG